MPYKLYYTNNLQNRCHQYLILLERTLFKKKKNLIEKFIEILSSNRNGKSIRIIRTTLFYIIYSIKFKRGTFCGHFLDISSIPKAKPLETFRFVVFTPPEKSSLPFHARKKISRTREREIERERKREREKRTNRIR